MIHEEIDQILEQAFKNVMRKSKFFQANRKILRKFLDAIKQEIENFACHEERGFEEKLRCIHKDGAGNAGYFVPFPGLSTTAHMYGRDSSTALYIEYFRMELTQNENLRPDTGRTDNGKGL